MTGSPRNTKNTQHVQQAVRMKSVAPLPTHERTLLLRPSTSQMDRFLWRYISSPGGCAACALLRFICANNNAGSDDLGEDAWRSI